LFKQVRLTWYRALLARDTAALDAAAHDTARFGMMVPIHPENRGSPRD
jgi:hypothetical protein